MIHGPILSVDLLADEIRLIRPNVGRQAGLRDDIRKRLSNRIFLITMCWANVASSQLLSAH